MTKEPWLAVNLSMFLPGLGQCYGEKWFRGLFWFLCVIALGLDGAWSILSPQGEIIRGVILVTGALLMYLINVFDAHQVVYRQRNEPKLEKIPRTHKNPWFAVFASRIIPGLGHIYLDRPNLGLILLALSLVTLQLQNFFPFFLGVYPVIAAWTACDVFRGSRQSKTRSSHFWLVLITVAICCWGLLFNYFPIWLKQQVELFRIPSDSMQPTLQVGDRVLVQKSANYLPQVGDIIVFHVFPAIEAVDRDALAAPEETFYIKRVIGVPGTKIEIVNGRVYLNGSPITENYLKEPPNYQLEPVTVPEQSYFMLGDNRNASLDSHHWGFLPQKYILGHAYKICWPLRHEKSILSP